MVGRQADATICVSFCRNVEKRGCLITLLQTKLSQISAAAFLSKGEHIPMTSDIYCSLMAGSVVDLIQTQFGFKEFTKQDCTFSLFLFFTYANRSNGGLSA